MTNFHVSGSWDNLGRLFKLIKPFPQIPYFQEFSKMVE